MINLLILPAMPEAVRNQYRDRLAARFPEVNVTLVDHHSKVGPHIATADRRKNACTATVRATTWWNVR